MRSLERSLCIAASAFVPKLESGLLGLSGAVLSTLVLASAAENVVLGLDVAAAAGLAGLFFSSEFMFEEASYEIASALSADQGLFNSGLSRWALFNPGADIDLSTTTDFEDCAGPAADLVEFTDQDRALLGDSIFAAQSRHVLAGAAIGASAGLATALLSSALVKRRG